MSPKATERGAEVANPKGLTEGLSFSEDYNPPVSFAASPLCTRGPQKGRYLSRIRKKKFRSSAAHSSFLTPPYTRG